jgi:hypothetical protein
MSSRFSPSPISTAFGCVSVDDVVGSGPEVFAPEAIRLLEITGEALCSARAKAPRPINATFGCVSVDDVVGSGLEVFAPEAIRLMESMGEAPCSARAKVEDLLSDLQID